MHGGTHNKQIIIIIIKGWFIHKVQNISVLTSEITQNFSD